MPPEALRCKECKTEYPLDARYVCEQCFGPLEVALRLARRADPAELKRPDPGRARTRSGATPTSCPSSTRSRRSAPAGRRSCAPTGSPRSSASASCGSRTTPPTRRTRSRTGSCRSRWRAPRSSASRRSPARRPATSPTPSPPTPRRPGLESYVFIPSDLEEQKVLATGIYGTNLVAVNGNYDDVNRLCTELAGEHDWAFVNINMRPYYAEGSKTLAFEIAEQLGFELPDRVVAPIASGSLFTKLARGFEEWLEVGLLEGELPTFNGAQAEGCSPVATAFERGPRLLPPGEAGDDRQVAGDRQPGRRPVRARSGAPHRRLDRRGHRRRDPRRHQAARADHGHLHRDRRRRDHRGAAQARRARRHRPRRARRRRDHGRGTEDARVRPRHVRGVGDRCRTPSPSSRRASAVGVLPEHKTASQMPVNVKIPTQLRAATDGEAVAAVEGATVAEVLDALYERFGELKPDRRRRRPAAVRQRLRRR